MDHEVWRVSANDNMEVGFDRAAIRLKVLIVINRVITFLIAVNRNRARRRRRNTSLCHRITVLYMILLVLHDVSPNKMY